MKTVSCGKSALMDGIFPVGGRHSTCCSTLIIFPFQGALDVLMGGRCDNVDTLVAYLKGRIASFLV